MKKLICIISLALSVFVSATETDVLPMPASITESLPWFAIREINDSNSPFTRTYLEKLAKTGERTAVVFFATWCNPCKAGIKQLASAKADLDRNNIKVVLVNIGVKEVEEKKIRSWVKSLNADSFKLVIDPFKVMTEGFGLVDKSGEITLPKTLILDPNAKPLFLLGQEGSDWPRIIWEKK